MICKAAKLFAIPTQFIFYVVQPKTALAETPGSKFLADCENLAHENKVDELVHRFAAQVDTIYSRCSDKGVRACCGSR